MICTAIKGRCKGDNHERIVTFGELMVRLQPFNYERFLQANTLEFTFGDGSGRIQR